MIRSLPGQLGEVRHILDLAPHRQIRGVLESTFPRARYVGVDLYEPDRAIDLLADITRLPIADASTQLVICYHVLEHVPDDRTAMRELARVLAPEGLALIQVPYRANAPTDEDPSLPPEVRAERFGQEDHVRHYGHDFDGRLQEAGLVVSRREPGDLVDAEAVPWMGASPAEPVWFGRSGPRALPHIPDRATWLRERVGHRSSRAWRPWNRLADLLRSART